MAATEQPSTRGRTARALVRDYASGLKSACMRCLALQAPQTHADVLERSAEARELVALEVRHLGLSGYPRAHDGRPMRTRLEVPRNPAMGHIPPRL